MMFNLTQKQKLYWSATDTYIRYEAVINEIKKVNNGRPLTILDIGGTSVILDMLDLNSLDITILNQGLSSISCIKKNNNNIKALLGDGCMLPFKSESVDLTISVATLEHIPKSKRREFLDEIKRVTKNKVIIYSPIRETGERFDKKLYRIKSLVGIRDPWTKEHIKYGLPDVKTLRKDLPGSKINRIQNAYVWLVLALLVCIPWFRFFLPGLAYTLALNKFDNNPPYYGGIIIWENNTVGKGRYEERNKNIH